MGKGSGQRPTDYAKYSETWERIWGIDHEEDDDDGDEESETPEKIDDRGNEP